METTHCDAGNKTAIRQIQKVMTAHGYRTKFLYHQYRAKPVFQHRPDSRPPKSRSAALLGFQKDCICRRIKVRLTVCRTWTNRRRSAGSLREADSRTERLAQRCTRTLSGHSSL